MKNPWPIAIVLFFAALIAAIVVFVVWSGKHGDDLVSATYYEEELQYQGRIDAANRARVEGVIPTVHVDKTAAVLAVQFSSNAAPASGEIRLYRPSQLIIDKVVTISCDDRLMHRIATQELAAGLWRLKVTWVAAGKVYFHEEALVIP